MPFVPRIPASAFQVPVEQVLFAGHDAEGKSLRVISEGRYLTIEHDDWTLWGTSPVVVSGQLPSIEYPAVTEDDR